MMLLNSRNFLNYFWYKFKLLKYLKLLMIFLLFCEGSHRDKLIALTALSMMTVELVGKTICMEFFKYFLSYNWASLFYRITCISAHKKSALF